MTILGISGSLREGSHNSRLLAAAARELPDGVELRVFTGLRDVPPYDQDDDTGDPPAAVARLRRELAEADGLLVATPEYNSSIPGQLKNALDWASRPKDESVLRFLPAAVVSASTGSFGAIWAQMELRKVLGASGARTVEGEVALPHADRQFDAEGRLVDDAMRERLRDLVGRLVDEAVRDRVAA
ncbi:NADPH-dependent FMN reductase [Miltoncostaea marina]|uniref:NADPH-dependent FMN reductase n=1 Tax=Miltoncostaea marina TaxID=2843215 RepID=UPI001C3C8865|nr:NAD(P)H-dependent oxidoreductase [Miltoncostaea marina]